MNTTNQTNQINQINQTNSINNMINLTTTQTNAIDTLINSIEGMTKFETANMYFESFDDLLDLFNEFDGFHVGIYDLKGALTVLSQGNNLNQALELAHDAKLATNELNTFALMDLFESTRMRSEFMSMKQEINNIIGVQ